MNIEDGIVEHLTEKYQPKCIILHGSRARAKARENSDWDLYIFVDSEISGGSEEFNGEQLDVRVMNLPIEQYDFIDEFGPTLKSAKVLYDTDNLGANLVEEAKNIYGQGRELSPRDLLNRKNRAARLLDRIQGTTNEPMTQFYHLGSFYESVIRYWYEIRKEWNEPPYIALQDIAERDSNFFEQLKIISGNYTPEQKAAGAEKIYNQLFN